MAMGLAFLFSQALRRGPGHHANSARVGEAGLDRTLAALFSTLQPETTDSTLC